MEMEGLLHTPPCWGSLLGFRGRLLRLLDHSASVGSPSLLASDSRALQAICQCVW